MALLYAPSSSGATHTQLRGFNHKLAFSKPNGPVLSWVPRKAQSSFLVKCLQIDTNSAALNDGQKQVVLLEGFEPAIYTPPKDLKRGDFPADFFFGASTSAIQTEGRGDEGGRGKSTWDFMIQASQGRKAVDSYNLYKEDVKLLKDMGMTAYRFSIAWPRILPQGTLEGGVNQDGIDFYNNFIQELIDNDITPVVTLFHFDLPANIQNQFYGFMQDDIIKHFKDYADLCFQKFGDKVKIWSTINEPFVFGSYGYKMGLPDQLKNDPLGPYKATHHIILSHAAVTQLYRDKYQKTQGGKIGICLPCKWYDPYSVDPTDYVASHIQLDFMLGWYMDPLYNGDYPETMKKFVKGLPEFKEEEKQLVKGAYDYIGINYYTSRYSKQQCTVDPQAGLITIVLSEDTVDEKGDSIGWQAQGQPDIYVHPDGLKKLLLYMKTKYGNPLMYVTENGVPAKPTITDSVTNLIAQGKKDELKVAFIDDYRCQHAEDHLTAVREAYREGANVKGYFVWTLMDNMEVGAGYDCRYGLNFTDYYDNLKRYPKLSAKWFKEFLEQDESEDKDETEDKDESKGKKKKHGHHKILPF